MAKQEYPKSDGRSFVVSEEDRKSDKYPNFKGWITITKDQIQMLIKMGKAGKEPKLQISEWDRKAQESGKPYRYIEAEAYFKEDAPKDDWGDDDIPF
jgi:hypothetical protein